MNISNISETRYTINRDGTLEKWYLEAEENGLVYLRKTPRPKWNCCMKEFSKEFVFDSYRDAKAELKRRSQKGGPRR